MTGRSEHLNNEGGYDYAPPDAPIPERYISHSIRSPAPTDVRLVQSILAERFSGGIHRNLGRDWVQTGPDQVNILALAKKIVDALNTSWWESPRQSADTPPATPCTVSSLKLPTADARAVSRRSW